MQIDGGFVAYFSFDRDEYTEEHDPFSDKFSGLVLKANTLEALLKRVVEDPSLWQYLYGKGYNLETGEEHTEYPDGWDELLLGDLFLTRKEDEPKEPLVERMRPPQPDVAGHGEADFGVDHRLRFGSLIGNDFVVQPRGYCGHGTSGLPESHVAVVLRKISAERRIQAQTHIVRRTTDAEGKSIPPVLQLPDSRLIASWEKVMKRC